MKRLLKALSTLSVLMLLVVLTSCGSNKFYKEWSKAGAEIEEENIFEYIELESVKEKIATGETFVLVYASSENAQSISAINSFQAQYDYLCTNDEEIVIYVLDSTDYDKSSERKEAKEALVVVPDDQLSLAIGIGGQNVRLAHRLTGWKIDIKCLSQVEESGYYEQGAETNYEETEEEYLENEVEE